MRMNYGEMLCVCVCVCVCVCLSVCGDGIEDRREGMIEKKSWVQEKETERHLNLNTLSISFLPFHACPEQRSLLFIQGISRKKIT